MPRRRYVWDPMVRELVEVGSTNRTQRSADGPMVQGNFKPIMGIDDRGKWRRYEREHNLVPFEPVDTAGIKARREKIERDRRISDVRDSYEHVRNQERARQRFG